jgi:hypothetical protein
MKISKLIKLAGVFFALAWGTTAVLAQGYGYGNNRSLSSDYICLNQISDLTNEQKNKIQELAKNHQSTMDALRDERRSTTDWDTKDEIRLKMLQAKVEHRKEVKSLLNEKQQQEYDLIQSGRQGNYRGRQFARGNRGGCRGMQNGFRTP